MTQQEQRVMALTQAAFAGVTLGSGVGLRQADGLDSYADSRALASLRAQDEERDWARIPAADLDRYHAGLSFFDGEGMRFHLPAYLVADLQGKLRAVDMLFHLAYLADGAAERFALLSPAQRNPNYEFVHPTIEIALLEYWDRS